MKIARILPLSLAFALVGIISCVAGPGAAISSPSALPTVQTNRLTLLIPAADSRFHYEGRIDFSNSNAPVITWQASRIRLDFDGPAIHLLFDDAKGQNYFNAQVDGSNTIVTVNEGMPASPATLTGLGSGRHHLMLFKRSEAAAGTAGFRGIRLTAGATAWASAVPHYKLAMEFIGDSITVGACNEDGPADQWENRRTHDCALS